MSVATHFTRHYPFLLESDKLSLSRDFDLQESGLLDVSLGAHHQVRTQGKAILLTIINTTTYGNLAELAGRKGISGGQLCELLGFLNRVGALERRRTIRGQCKAASLQCIHLLFGSRYAPMSWRQQPTWPAIIYGVLRATWPVTIAVLGVGALAAGSSLLSLGILLGISAWGLGTFIGSLVVHEAVHVSIANRNGVKPQLLQFGLRLGVIHRPMQPRAEIISALAGPLAGGTICTLTAVILYLSHATLLALPCAAAALFHACGLLPRYGDGASVYKALCKKRLGTNS